MEKDIERIIEMVKKDEKILAVFLFGSYLKEENYNDIDVCLVTKKNIKNDELSKIKLRYSSEFPNLDISIFQQLPIYIKKRVISEGKLLFAKDLDELYDIVLETIREFDDFKKIYDEYLNGVLNG